QFEDGNPAQVDLLPPREIKQQVERAFPAVEFKIKRIVLTRRGRGRGPGPVPTGQRTRIEVGLAHQARSPVSASKASRFASNPARGAKSTLAGSVAASARSSRAAVASDMVGSASAMPTMSVICAQQLS